MYFKSSQSVPLFSVATCSNLNCAFLHLPLTSQPDITWCGGITEARRIVALASAYDIPVVPHGSSVYSFHLQYAFPNCPIAECLIMSPKADKIVPYVIQTKERGERGARGWARGWEDGQERATRVGIGN